MGGSRRRLKKTRTKVRVALVKRGKDEKSKVPKAITIGADDIAEKLNIAAEWELRANLTTNYEKNKLVHDANLGYGRNKHGSNVRTKEEKEALGEECYSDDDEFRAASHLERKTGKAEPARPTAHQRAILSKLMEVHKEDLDAMVLDTKLNKMQHSAGQLAKMINAYRHWDSDGAKTKHDFRGPGKPYKRL
eukprot:gene11110-18733_t